VRSQFYYLWIGCSGYHAYHRTQGHQGPRRQQSHHARQAGQQQQVLGKAPISVGLPERASRRR
jgi:hypothetical protein